MAIDDAIVLARALRDEASIATACARYERERLPPHAADRRAQLELRANVPLAQLAVWFRERMLGMTPQRVMHRVQRSQILDDVGVL